MSGVRTAIVVISVTLTAPCAGQEVASSIELEVFSHGGLHYFQALDRSGSLRVEIVQERNGLDVARSGGSATVPAEVFQAIRSLVEDIARDRTSSFARRELGAIIVLRNVDGEIIERVTLDEVSPGRRRLLLDMFSVLHSYAADSHIDLVGDQSFSFPREESPWPLLRIHLYLMEGALALALVLLGILVARRRSRSTGSE